MAERIPVIVQGYGGKPFCLWTTETAVETTRKTVIVQNEAGNQSFPWHRKEVFAYDAEMFRLLSLASESQEYSELQRLWNSCTLYQ